MLHIDGDSGINIKENYICVMFFFYMKSELLLIYFID